MKKITALLSSVCILALSFQSLPMSVVNYASAVDADVTDSSSTEVVAETFTVTLSDSGITTDADAETASVTGKILTITKPAIFEISGEISEGQIVVNVDKELYPEGVVELDLKGVNITNTSDSPIYIASIGDECEIVSKKGTENTISDGTDYTNADGKAGAIYACDDIKIKGAGTLTVNGNCNDAIVCKNDIKIYNGTLIVNSADDGIRGKDSVTIGNKKDTDFSKLNITVNSKNGDGIKSTETDTASSKGFITVNGGTINITAYSDGFHASQNLDINGGDISITTTCPASSSGNNNSGWGGPGGGRFPNMGNDSSSSSTEVSAKGIKAGCTDDTGTVIEGTINIAGGIISVNSTDDSIHATDINISGGEITASSGDDGIHADNILTVTDGLINITKSYEGLEAYDIEIKGGNIHVVSSDDGFNAAGGNDNSGNNNNGWGQGGGWGFGGSSSTGVLNISGGYMYVRAEGDGLDSNGSLSISGGTVIVCGPTKGGNGIFDKGDGNYTMNFTGGTVFGIGSSDMMETPTTSNGTYLVSTRANLQAGQLVFVKENNEVISVLTVPSDINMSSGAVQFYSDRAGKNAEISFGGSYSGTLNADGYGEGNEPVVTTSTTSSSTTTTTTTTMTSSDNKDGLKGDANDDGTVDVADVVAVASYVGNPESNKLTSKGITNSDVHNTGDGLTANDALMIQQYIAKIVEVL
ncbi:MAG: carbohydrate-binding domain-containing protein [Oscillospiraceae bacterium]|nr:carbohydrate-binding domain-containing protein [Oscillospiraceae bacterium]